jgi:hypothetical protein
MPARFVRITWRVGPETGVRRAGDREGKEKNRKDVPAAGNDGPRSVSR